MRTLPEHSAREAVHRIEPDVVLAMLLGGAEHDFLLAFKIGGMHAASGALNARTRYRMTALCSIAEDGPACIAVYDRERPRGHRELDGVDLPSMATAIAAGSGATAMTATGSAVLDHSGETWGALFHYDRRLRIMTSYESAVVTHLGRRLSFLCPGALRRA